MRQEAGNDGFEAMVVGLKDGKLRFGRERGGNFEADQDGVVVGRYYLGGGVPNPGVNWVWVSGNGVVRGGHLKGNEGEEEMEVRGSCGGQGDSCPQTAEDVTTKQRHQAFMHDQKRV